MKTIILKLKDKEAEGFAYLKRTYPGESNEELMVRALNALLEKEDDSEVKKSENACG